MDLVENIPGREHIFEAGTLEGLMKLMLENNETAIGSYDEFATFIDSLDNRRWRTPVVRGGIGGIRGDKAVALNALFPKKRLQ